MNCRIWPELTAFWTRAAAMLNVASVTFVGSSPFSHKTMNKETEITSWLKYFANMVLEAQNNTIRRVDFYVAKAKFYEKHRGTLNERQEKVIARIFREGIDGFKGGLSAENYISITGTSRATTTRDLQDLIEKGALTKTGELRHTRYHLNLAKA